MLPRLCQGIVFRFLPAIALALWGAVAAARGGADADDPLPWADAVRAGGDPATLAREFPVESDWLRQDVTDPAPGRPGGPREGHRHLLHPGHLSRPRARRDRARHGEETARRRARLPRRRGRVEPQRRPRRQCARQHARLHRQRIVGCEARARRSHRPPGRLGESILDKTAKRRWIDLLVPYCASYQEASAWSDGEIRKYQRFAEKRRRMETK